MNDLLITAFGGKVFALDRKTGAQAWRVQLSEFSTATIDLLFTGDAVLAVSGTHLALIERSSGTVRKLVERKDEGTGRRAVALLDGQQLFIGSEGAVVCYSLELELQWNQYFKGEGFGPVALGFPGNVRQADDRGSK